MANFILQNTEPSTQLSASLTSNIVYDGGALTNVPASTNNTINTILSGLNTTIGTINSSLANISGTSTKLAKFTGTSTVGNSILTEGTNTITLTGATSSLNEVIINDSAKPLSVGVRGSAHSSGVTANGAQGDAYISTGAGVNGLNIIKSAGGGSEADYLRFYAGNTPTGTAMIHITGKTSGASEIGNVGINQQVPDKKFEVLHTDTQLRLTHTNASKFVDFTVDTNHDLLIKPSSTGQIKLQPTTDSVDFFQVLDADGGNPVLNVDSTNERIGIGTASPSEELHISGSGNQTILVQSTGGDSYIKLLSSDTDNSFIDFEETSGNRWMIGGYATNDLFAFADGSAFSSSMRLSITKSAGGAGSQFRIYDGTTNLRYVGLQTVNTLAASTSYTFPSAVPSANGQVLSSTTAGVMSWVTKYDHLPVKTETGTGLNLSSSEEGYHINFTNGSAVTVNVRPDSDHDFPIGTEIEFCKRGVGNPTLTRGSGVELWTPDGIDADFAITGLHSVARIKKIAADKWQVINVVGQAQASVNITATTDGTGTGTIPDGATFVTVSTDNTDKIVILPAPTPGAIVWMSCVGEAQAWELRSSAPASVKINGGSGTNAESAINAGSSLVRAVCANATNWVVTEFAANGTESAGEAAA